MKKLIVNQKFNNKSLTSFILYTFPNLSKNTLYKAFRKKDILVNNVRVNCDVKINTNDEIIIYIQDKFLENSIELDIIFEDDNILIINKPSGLAVNNLNGLNDLVSKKYSNLDFMPMPCHRLDRNTQGLIIYAKNNTSLLEIENAFKKHFIEKYYLCKVYGILSKKSQTLNDYLFKDSKKSIVYISSTYKKGYLPICTTYKVLNENKKENTSILEVKLETGKTHQIRAHLAFIGHPIIGDGKYGDNLINKKFKEKSQVLYSYKIKFHFNEDNYLFYLNNKEFVYEINPKSHI